MWRTISNIQRGECSCAAPINHGHFGPAEESWAGFFSPAHAATESLAATVAHARTDMEANQQP